MMMSALAAGGMQLLDDGERQADENNPKGYYEFERVKQLPKGDIGWLKLARGKAVKVISGLLEYLPDHFAYRIIFMERDIDELLDSQKRMLGRKGIESQQPVSEDEIRHAYQAHLRGVHAWLADQGNIKTLLVSYNEAMANPYDVFHRIADFLEGRVDPRAMTTVVDPRLYREKKSDHAD